MRTCWNFRVLLGNFLVVGSWLFIMLCLFRVFVTEGQEPILATLKWSPNGQMIAGLSTDNKLFVWNINGDIIMQHNTVQTNGNISWSGDSSRIGIVENSEILIINISQTTLPVGAIIARLNAPNNNDMIWSFDGNYIIANEYNPVVNPRYSVWQVDNLTNTFTQIYNGYGPEYGIKLSPNSQKLAVWGSGGTGWQDILDMIGDFVSFGSPDAVAWSPDSRYLAILAQYPNRLRVYDTSIPVPAVNNDGNLAWQLSGDATLPSPYLEWSPDGTRMASIVEINGVNMVQVFNANTGTILQRYPLNTSIINEAITWSPDGSRLAYPNIVNGVSSFVIVTPPTVSSPTATFTPNPTSTFTPKP